MPDTLVFRDIDATQLGVPRVYTRARWADAWAEQPHLHPEETIWSTSPTMPTAQLVWPYGRVVQPDASSYSFVDKLDWIPGRYVKIEMPCELDDAATAAAGEPVFRNRYWFGLIEQIIDDQLGTHDYPQFNAQGRPAGTRNTATGTQRFVCFGMEQLLARHRIRTSVFDRGAGLVGNDSTIPFNLPGGRGNRGLVEYDGAYAFYYDLDGGAANVSTWNTREIVRYLLRRQSPRDTLNARAIKWRVAADSIDLLPNWDLPFLDQDNATTLSLLQRVVDRRRLLSFWFDVVTDAGEDIVEMHVATIVPNDVPLTIAPTAKIVAAANQVVLDYDRDPATHGYVRDSEIGLYDQVVARGARLCTVATFSHIDGTLAKAWTPGDQTRYEYGAQATANFSTAGLAEQQRRHAAARSDPRLEDVFARFRIPPTWDQRTGDGFGGIFFDAFPSSSGPVPIYYPSMGLRSSLPLAPKVDYSGDRVSLGLAAAAEPKGELEYLPIQSYWKRPVADADGVRRWMRGDEIGKTALLEGIDPEDAQRISIHAHAIPGSHSVVFRVSGGPQHAIAAGDFSKAPEDEQPGGWTYRGGAACVTLALDWGLHVEGIWPPLKPPGKDAIRVLVVEAGQHYERIYVAPMTVVGVSDDGALVRSNGGWIERPSNCVVRLEDFAHLAHAWYSIPHQVATVESRRLVSASSIDLGWLVTSVGDPTKPGNPAAKTVNATVTQIKVRWEQAADADPDGPSMTIDTFAGELDALSIGPADLPGLANPFRARRALQL